MADPKISIEEAYEVFNKPGAVESLPSKNQGFVKSLLSSKAKYGKNTLKQQHWIRVYAEKVVQDAPSHEMIVSLVVGDTHAPQAPAAPSTIMVGDALYAMLKKAEDYVFAKGGKKRPQIKFSKSPQTPRVAFKIAGKTSKYKGQIMVTSGGAYGQSMFFGRIDQGTFHPAPKASPEIIAFVKQFAAEPHKMGSAYGLATMHCCFCSKAIDTVDSKAMGYGPVCASKFGLPWGKKATKEAGANIGSGFAVKAATKPSKWIEMDDAVEQMQKLAKATGTTVGSVQGFAKAVAATGLSEPIEEEEAPVFASQPDLVAEAAQASPSTPQDFGFTCETCMDTGKDLTPEGQLVDCGSCK